ncbi:MAG TPA: PilX N-terminal domain-containing pilus assembly protein [Steroidobacteraceae bacterium]|nr:PilX N-terminal domain-containing pilus assembly protein [Steroidobacteraceae bacterium]
MTKLASSKQHGIVLVSTLLLLVVVIIMTVSMMRSFTVQEKVAGNFKEKQRALQVAESAEQSAEYWLSQNAGTQAGQCKSTVDGTAGQGQICSNPLDNAATLPWTTNGGTAAGVTTMLLKDMNVATASTSTQGTYAQQPQYYIYDLGAKGNGEVYQIDAVGFGGGSDGGNAGTSGSTTATAVVESYVEVTCTTGNAGSLNPCS